MKNYLIGLVFILVSCNGQKKAGMESGKGQSTSEESPLVLILQEEYSGFQVAETMVIRDQKRLKSFYSKINQTRKPGLPIPIIDFTKEQVIVQCNGEQNYVGLPTLTLSSETDSEIVLMAKTKKDDSKEVAITVLTNPYCVYKMPLTDKEIVVEKGIK